ncbi:MAG: hypothetical protein AAGJ79_03720 [Verrucomicrobiota bacterium]
MRTIAGFLVLLGAAWTAVAEDTLIDRVNDGANFLAGMKGRSGGTAAQYEGGSEWRYHARAMDSQWSKYEASTLGPMVEWSAGKVEPFFLEEGTVRYLFSGPDVLHVLRMYPKAGRILMGGLEPVGVLPTLDRLEGGAAYRALSEVRKALEESLAYSFFKTKDMKVDLTTATYRGTLPIIALYLVRSGYAIDGVTFYTLQTDGSLLSQATRADGANVVRVRAEKGDGRTVEILYFQSNVANGSIEQSGFLQFLEAQPPGGAYLKAASYLLHESYFSVVRDHLIRHSNILVQDDSGVPIKHFAASDWDLTHFGTYVSPIPLFRENYQSDLRHAYRSSGIEPLPFGSGYRWRKSDSNLMRAVRKRPLESGPAGPILAKLAPPPAPKEVVPVKAKPVKVAARTAEQKKEPVPVVVEGRTAKHTGGAIDVELRLVRKSALPAGTSRNTFGVFEYEVLRVNRGSYGGKLIRVAHGLHWSGRVTATATKQLGSTTSVRLVPLSNYANLAFIPTVNDLGEDEGTLFVAEL